MIELFDQIFGDLTVLETNLSIYDKARKIRRIPKIPQSTLG